MANWKHKLEIKDDWQKAQSGEITHNQMANVISEKCKALAPLIHDDELRSELGCIAEDFEHVSKNSADVEDFDDVMQRLYDWADSPVGFGFCNEKLCWVATF